MGYIMKNRATAIGIEMTGASPIEREPLGIVRQAGGIVPHRDPNPYTGEDPDGRILLEESRSLWLLCYA